MTFLRLKSYTTAIFDRYLQLQDEPTEDEKMTLLGKRLRTSYTICCKTVLFFAQPQKEMSLEDWCNHTPLSFQMEVDHFISLLEDSVRWGISAIGVPTGYKPDELVRRLNADMASLKIVLQPNYENDAVTTQFEKLCNLIHNEVPDNLRKRKALIRLIWAYISGKQLISMSREFTCSDRIEYLKSLTRY